MNNNIPVVIFHQGYKPYLKINCQITAKNNNVILLGDPSLEKLSKIPNVEFVNTDDIIKKEKIDYFKSHFVNYNTVNEKSVWLWYLRVFSLGQFLQDYKIDKIFHIDSDNILLKNINDYIFKADNAYCISKDWHEYTMSASIHSGLLNTNFFKQFENLYYNLFISKEMFYLIEKKIKYHNENGGGGVCDMTLFYLLDKLGLLKVQNLLIPNKINHKEYVFINNINTGEGYEIQNQFKMKSKSIQVLKDNKNFENKIFDLNHNKDLYIYNIHFQGPGKKKMNSFLKYKLNF